MSLAAELRSLDRYQWGAVVASFLGWTLDAFDFFLMVFMFGDIAREFHTNVPAVAIAGTLTLAARPFGALFFGRLADQFGRKPILMLDIALFSVMEFASAFAPTLISLLFMRALFGFAMGGEWGIGASLVMESVPPKARGFLSGVLQEGYAAGYLLAALASFLLYEKIGWRGMFMVGIVPALLIGLITLMVKESPVFEAQRPPVSARTVASTLGVGLLALGVAVGPALVGALNKDAMLGWVYFVDAPLALCGLWLFRKHWRMAIYAVAMMTAFNFFSHGAQDLYPTFLEKQHHFSVGLRTSLTMLGNVGAIAGGLLFGAWSEQLGRRRTMALAALLGVLVIPLWAFSHTIPMLALGVVLIQVSVQGSWGVIPAHLNELSPGDARGAFPGFAYQLGNILASGCIVWQSQIAEARGGDYGFALALVVGIVAVAIALLTLFGPERQGVNFAAAQD